MEIEVHTYGKSELASLYMPNVQPSTARKIMMSWIEGNARLKAELLDAGYRKSVVLLTPRQIEIIFKHLGRP